MHKLRIFYCTNACVIQIELHNLKTCKLPHQLELNFVCTDGPTHQHVFKSYSSVARLKHVPRRRCRLVHIVNDVELHHVKDTRVGQFPHIKNGASTSEGSGHFVNKNGMFESGKGLALIVIRPIRRGSFPALNPFA